MLLENVTASAQLIVPLDRGVTVVAVIALPCRSTDVLQVQQTPTRIAVLGVLVLGLPFLSAYGAMNRWHGASGLYLRAS